MGASEGGYRCRVADIRTARPDDLDGIFDLLSTRSRAAFGISEIVREHVADELGRANGTDRWVALDGASIVGYAAIDSAQDLVHAAVDAEIGDALLARATARALERGFGHIAVTAVPEDRPLTSLVERHRFVHDRDILRMWRSSGRRPAGAAVARGRLRSHVRGCGRRTRSRTARSELRRLGHDATLPCRTTSGSPS